MGRKCIRAIVEAGPDTGLDVELVEGDHLVGRAAHCSVSLSDPLIEPHHLQVVVAVDVAVSQLSGRFGIDLSREGTDRVVEFGSTRLRLGGQRSVRATPPAVPTLRYVPADGPDLDRRLALARRSFVDQQHWLARYHPGRFLLGYGPQRVIAEILDEHGEALTVSELGFADQARYDDGLMVDGCPVIARRDRPIVVAGDEPLRSEIVARLEGVISADVVPVARGADRPVAACLELGDRWRAEWIAHPADPRPVTVHLALPAARDDP